ncbi:MAG: IPT/TIG domain-containing protein [Thermodesulfobacteriota bacterium]|nr:IPT/TIG domain-containing protein [Thermodesulfobacteriota bacterium]
MSGYNGDVWILRLDSAGNVVWFKSYGGIYSVGAVGSDGLATDDGYIVAGETECFTASACEDILVLKVDTDGEIPYCVAANTGNPVGIVSSVVLNDTQKSPVPCPGVSADTPLMASYDPTTQSAQICPTQPNIVQLDPNHGGYGTKIKVEGSGFADPWSKMVNATDGYYSVVSFSGLPDTLIATRYPNWSYTLTKTKFKFLFVDLDNDYLHDGNEPLVTVGQLDLDYYDMQVHTIWFHDLVSDGLYGEGDEIYHVESSNSEIFNLTDEPVIYTLIPESIPASQPGSPQKVKIKGLNFGATQGSSTVHIGGKTWSAGHPKIKTWEDYKIKFKVPVYESPFPKWKQIWVTVNGKPSNVVWLKITAP